MTPTLALALAALSIVFIIVATYIAYDKKIDAILSDSLSDESQSSPSDDEFTPVPLSDWEKDLLKYGQVPTPTLHSTTLRIENNRIVGTEPSQPETVTTSQEDNMPTSTPRYKTLDTIVSTLTEAGVDESTVADVKAAYQAKNPSAFRDESPLSDSEFRKRTVEMTRRHLRRFPRTQSALALSLAGLAKGESNRYVP